MNQPAVGLDNPLKNFTSQKMQQFSREAQALAISLATGFDQKVSTVNSAIGNSLSDTALALGVVVSNIGYAASLINIGQEYLGSIANSSQKLLETIISANGKSQDKLAILGQDVTNLKAQINNLIATAEFDGKNLLDGGIKDLKVQVGIAAADTTQISVTDQSGGKLFRANVTNALNNWIAADATGGRTAHYAAAALATAISNNENLVHVGGSGAMTNTNIGDALVAIRTADPNIFANMEVAAPLFTAQLNAIPATWVNATSANFQTALGNGGAKTELLAILADNAPLTLTSNTTLAVSQEVVQGMLNQVRSIQATMQNQLASIMGASDALAVTQNVTQDAADSFLKTDYIKRGQEYSEIIKRMTALITTLTAQSKVSDAVQRFLDFLAR